jgi:hypothetical protein
MRVGLISWLRLHWLVTRRCTAVVVGGCLAVSWLCFIPPCWWWVLVWVRLGLFFHASGCLALDGIVRVGKDGVCKGHEFCLM